MPPRLRLKGQRFGRLLVLAECGQDSRRAYLWRCACDCGAESIVRGSRLKAGITRSCGCGIRDAASRPRTHGMSHSALYMRWRAMLGRTGNAKNAGYHNYGGRGITVCARWASSFEAFRDDMGPTFSPELELDRIDVNGPYAPDNCRWATQTEQQRNRRNNHVVSWRGRSMVVTDWAVELGITPNTLIYRLRRGWSVERAFTTPVVPRQRRSRSAGSVIELSNEKELARA